MAIFVDECRWTYRDYKMCHMVSNESLEELHAFAKNLDIPLRAFHGDHYDIPMHIRSVALQHGACAVTSRELVQALTQAGLRLSAAQRRAYKHAHEGDHDEKSNEQSPSNPLIGEQIPNDLAHR